MKRLLSKELANKSPDKKILAGWSGHLESAGKGHPNSIHTLILGKEVKGFNSVFLCWGENHGNKISNYLVFKGRYNFWIPGKSSQKMAIEALERLAKACSRVDSSYFHKLFPIRSRMSPEEINDLEMFWNKAVEDCWKLTRHNVKSSWEL